MGTAGGQIWQLWGNGKKGTRALGAVVLLVVPLPLEDGRVEVVLSHLISS